MSAGCSFKKRDRFKTVKCEVQNPATEIDIYERRLKF